MSNTRTHHDRETKTVNAWFQNKRASTKKRSKGVALAGASQPTNSVPVHYQPTSYPPHRPAFEEYPDENYHLPYSRASPAITADFPPFEHPHHMSESNVARYMRLRPSSDQVDQLQRLYNINPFPSTEEMEALAQRIGMWVILASIIS